MSTMNYYVVLGIAEDADGDTIRSAFRALARRYHPDAGPGSSAVEFQRALEAYETVSDLNADGFTTGTCGRLACGR
jgi:curved DNA-binding protein CbpA